MKALSLIQPYATLIMLGYRFKHYETRSWSTKHRGTLGIHASAGKPDWARKVSLEDLHIRQALAAHGFTFDSLPRGALLGTCEVRDVHAITPEFSRKLSPMELSAGDYTPGRWAWQLENVQPLEVPVPCRGALSLWEMPKEVLAGMLSQYVQGVASVNEATLATPLGKLHCIQTNRPDQPEELQWFARHANDKFTGAPWPTIAVAAQDLLSWATGGHAQAKEVVYLADAGERPTVEGCLIHTRPCTQACGHCQRGGEHA